MLLPLHALPNSGFHRIEPSAPRTPMYICIHLLVFVSRTSVSLLVYFFKDSLSRTKTFEVSMSFNVRSLFRKKEKPRSFLFFSRPFLKRSRYFLFKTRTFEMRILRRGLGTFLSNSLSLVRTSKASNPLLSSPLVHPHLSTVFYPTTSLTKIVLLA